MGTHLSLNIRCAMAHRETVRRNTPPYHLSAAYSFMALSPNFLIKGDQWTTILRKITSRRQPVCDKFSPTEK